MRELDLLRFDYVDLSQLVSKKDGHSEVKISRPKPESSPPLDMLVVTLRWDMVWTTRKAEDHLRAHIQDRPRVDLPVREGFSLDCSIRYLSPRVDDLARLPEAAGPVGEDGMVYSGVDLLRLIGVLHSQARKVCGLDPRTITVPGDCPSCAAPSLRRLDDNPEKIWCVHCHLRLSKDDYYRVQRLQFAPVTPAADPR